MPPILLLVETLKSHSPTWSAHTSSSTCLGQTICFSLHLSQLELLFATPGGEHNTPHNHFSGAPHNFLAGFNGACQYPEAGIPTPTAARQDSHSHPRLRHKGRSCRAPRVRLLPHRANGPEPAPSSGTGPVTPRVSEEGKLRALTAGGSGPPTGSRTPIYYPDPSVGREQTPRLGQVQSRHVSAGAGTRAAAKLPREDSPSYRIQYGRRKCALPQQSLRRLLPGCTVDRALPRHTVQPLAPPTPCMSVCYASWTRRLAFAHHDAYAVDPTVYTATYTTSTGASPTALLGQRVHRAMKRIREEILNH